MATACSTPKPPAPHRGAPAGPAILNTTTIDDVAAAFTKAGLPLPNAHDVTSLECPRIACARASDSDTVSIVKFAGTGPAQRYAASIREMYQIEDIVLVFHPTVTPERKRAYEDVARRAVVSR